MARKTSYVTINDTGRDKGKVFFLTEMSATQAEKWAVRTLLAMARGGVELPNGILREGIMGIAVLGVINMMKIPFAEAEPLMVEMFQCIKFCPEASRQDIFRPLLEDDIEEVATRIKLRGEVLGLHLGFSLADAKLKLASWMQSAQELILKNTPMSQEQSAQ
jgi:hypothetical protein